MDFTNPDIRLNATIGEMVASSISQGYLYAPPACPDVFSIPKLTRVPDSNGGNPLSVVSKASLDKAKVAPSIKVRKPIIVFHEVACVDESYEIDVFLRGAKSRDPNPITNPDFIGRLFRLGMGIAQGRSEAANRSRCRKSTVSRVMEVEQFADRIEGGFYQVVKRLGVDGPREVPEDEWKAMAGFTGRLLWVS